MTSVALLGTGTMGAAIAGSILRHDLDLTVWNRDRAKAEPLADRGARLADTAQDAVHGADVVLTMLFDADAVASVMDQPVKAGLLGDAVWLQTTTVGIEGTKRLASLAAAAGVVFVDAPVLGTKQPAAEGTLQVFWAGPSSARATAQPVLEAIASRVVEVADRPGPASALKLVCNAWLATLTAAAAQSVATARALGLDPQFFLDAIGAGPLNSPYAQTKAAEMISGNYEDAAFAVDNVRKDLGLIRDAMAAAGVDGSLINGVAQQFDDASARGQGRSDIAAVIAAYA
ncbi:MAG: 3-hydroxyisobutyrate dehydrogenase [Frankiales bacterium]|nr:3-hydroxyisobutyrate dehydrogenase [Frankiales bacterium]